MSEQANIGWEIELERQRVRILNVLLGAVVLGGAVAVVPPLSRVFADPGQLSYEWPFLTAYAVVLLAFLARRVNYHLRMAVPVVGGYLMALYLMQLNGVASHGSWFLMMVSTLLFTLAGQRAGLIGIVVSVLTFAGIGMAHYEGQIELGALLDPRLAQELQNVGSNFFMVLIIIGIAQSLFDRAREQAIRAAYERGDELAQAQGQLQERAGELARANVQLQKRAWQLEIAADVLSSTSGITDLDVLLNRVSELIYTQFRSLKVNCVGIFMVEAGTAVLRAVTEATDAQGPSLQTTGVPRAVRETLRSGDAAFVDKQDQVEDAQALELVLPLVSHPLPQGALYIRSNQRDAFQPEDLSTLRILADQLSIAIQNVNLLQQIQEQLREARLLSQEYTQDVWREASEAGVTFRYTPDQKGGVTKTRSSLAAPQIVQQTLQEGRMVTDHHRPPDDDGPGVVSMALPIIMRDTVIGVVNVQRSAGSQVNWSPEQITLAETVTEQLGLALESAQLYQTTQRRAAYERLVGEVTARLRESLDVDTVLRVAAREMGETLGLHDVSIHLELDPDQALS